MIEEKTMTFLAWGIAIGLMAFAGLRLTRRWEARQQAQQDAQSTADATTEGKDDVVGRATGIRSTLSAGVANLQSNLLGQKQPAIAPKFRGWIAQALVGEPQLQHWLAGLSDEQLNALATHIAAFSREMGFELTWLLDQEVAQQPVLAQGLTNVVRHYCQACRQSVTLQEELGPYKRLRDYEENPLSRQNRELGQALFGKLMEQGLTSVKVADHLALPERQRQQQIVAEVRQAATEHRTAFLHLMQEVVAQHNGAPPTTTAYSNGATSNAKS
jgi:hypothetical protein